MIVDFFKSNKCLLLSKNIFMAMEFSNVIYNNERFSRLTSSE